jgi:drug/metabolite transporter (DMT)-like permease
VTAIIVVLLADVTLHVFPVLAEPGHPDDRLDAIADTDFRVNLALIFGAAAVLLFALVYVYFTASPMSVPGSVAGVVAAIFLCLACLAADQTRRHDPHVRAAGICLYMTALFVLLIALSYILISLLLGHLRPSKAPETDDLELAIATPSHPIP